MIVSRTPLRISFFGGGTDLPEYYLHEEGCVLATAITKYIYVMANGRFDQTVEAADTCQQLGGYYDKLGRDLISECARKTGMSSSLRVVVLGDVPDAGTGLGSSSALAVGLLNAMYSAANQPQSAEGLALDAVAIEIGTLGRPIGVQDHYMAAYGGQRLLHFRTDGLVESESLRLDIAESIELQRHLMLFFVGARRADTVLQEQRRNTDHLFGPLTELKHLALQGWAYLRAGQLDDFGRLLHRGWQIKKRLASGISNNFIDNAYEAALQAGCLGGKICGAGGGGFLLLYCPPARQASVRAVLDSLRELHFAFEPEGTRIMCRSPALEHSDESHYLRL